jgi:Lon protease-like protein
MGLFDLNVDLTQFDGVTRLFPLPGVVMFPHVVFPLHIFEPRYRQMTRDALEGDRLITIIQSRPGVKNARGEPPLEQVGCLGKIVRHEELPDGRFQFLLLGCQRVQIIQEIQVETLYRQAKVSLLRDEEEPDPGSFDRDAIVRSFSDLLSLKGYSASEWAPMLDQSIPLGVLTDLMTHALEIPVAVKQAMLAETRVKRRIEGLRMILRELIARNPRRSESRGYPPPFSEN